MGVNANRTENLKRDVENGKIIKRATIDIKNHKSLSTSFFLWAETVFASLKSTSHNRLVAYYQKKIIFLSLDNTSFSLMIHVLDFFQEKNQEMEEKNHISRKLSSSFIS